MRILVWHVHGGWMDGFVQGGHDYLVPLQPDGCGGRSGRDWPANVIEVRPEQLIEKQLDVVVLQGMGQLDDAERWTGRRLGADLPAVYVEHNLPRGDAATTVHPLADRNDIPIVHVTHFNRLFWDGGMAPSTVVEHGVPDPGPLYTGALRSMGFVSNEAVRRWRVTGTDLLPAFASAGRIDAFGIAGDRLAEATGLGEDRLLFVGDLAPNALHARLAECRLYLHTVRWTSLGLSLIEAMHLGMPIVALASAEVIRAVPPEAGVISTNVDELVSAARRLLDDPEEAAELGAAARTFALERYGLPAFLARWDAVLADVAS